MAMPGRPPKPTKLHVLQGTYEAKRHAARNEPEPAGDLPRPPSLLRGEARAEWNRVVAAMGPTGVLTAADRALLTVHCQMWARFVAQEFGPEAEGCSAAFLATFASIAGKLGLTPSDRVKLRAPTTEKQESPFAALKAK
jgi:phage terminase small subunit